MRAFFVSFHLDFYSQLLGGAVDQLVQHDGFGDEVVGAEVVGLHDIFVGVEGGEHNDAKIRQFGILAYFLHQHHIQGDIIPPQGCCIC